MKNQENLNSHLNNTSTDVNSEMTKRLELSDKDFKEAIIKMFQKVKTNYLEINEKIESLRKEIEDI